MNNAEFQLRSVGDPRLAVHATSPFPAWLWSTDGTRVPWANPVGARVFGAANGVRLARKSFGPADSHRRQVARLAHRLPPSGAIRLERLRGFGAALGALITCGCARLEFADGSHGVLIAASEAVGRAMPLFERLQRLVEDFDTPIAAFARDGTLVGASDATRSLLGFHTLSEAGLEEARSEALKHGRAETPVAVGRMVLQRVGAGADVGLLALIAPGATAVAGVGHATLFSPADAIVTPPQLVAPPGDLPMVDYERPPLSGEAPAEFARLIGAHTATGFGRLWSEIAETFGLDPEGCVVKAIATRDTWSGITLNWPVDGGSHLLIELSGLPIYDDARNFVGYRGFGVCRDLGGLTRCAAANSAMTRRGWSRLPPLPPRLCRWLSRLWSPMPAPPQLSLHRQGQPFLRLHNQPIWKPLRKRPRKCWRKCCGKWRRTSFRFAPLASRKHRS